MIWHTTEGVNNRHIYTVDSSCRQFNQAWPLCNSKLADDYDGGVLFKTLMLPRGCEKAAIKASQ